MFTALMRVVARKGWRLGDFCYSMARVGAVGQIGFFLIWFIGN